MSRRATTKKGTRNPVTSPKSAESATGQQSDVKTISLRVRVIVVDSSHYHTRHVDIQLTPLQRHALGSLFGALHNAQPTKMANGRFVQTHADCVRWLLDQIGREVDEKGSGGRPGKQETDRPRTAQR